MSADHPGKITRRGLIAGASAGIGLAAAPDALVVPVRAASLIEDAFDTSPMVSTDAGFFADLTRLRIAPACE